MKIILLALTVLLTFTVSGQCIYSRSEVQIKGSMALFNKLMNVSSVTYQKNNKLRSNTRSMGVTQDIIAVDDKVTILNKFSPKCAIITKTELATDSLENDMPTTDLQMELTEDTLTLLGYVCRKTVIRYKIKGLNYETKVWTTREIKVPEPEIKPLESMKQNSYMMALKSLQGFALKTDTYMSSSAVRTIVTITEVSTKEIDDSVFEVDPKRCKEYMNLKEYKKELQRQKADRMGRY